MSGYRERDFLLATKLRVPRIRPGLVARPRLVERLEEASDRELVLVSAPAGFGKSTLLAEWVRATDRPVAWLSLDVDDNDPSRFWRYVSAAIGQVHPELAEPGAAMLDAADQRAVQAVVGALVNQLAEHPGELALVLDDYHVIDSPAIHDSVALLLDRLPQGMRVIVAGRSDPPLALASMRAGGQLVEVRARDLRFSPEEATALLLEAWGLDVPEQSLVALVERTEGWVTGLQLAALSLRGTSDPVRLVAGFTGSHRYVLDYLTEEVLERQPDSVRSFLLETSILERLSGPLADAVTGGSEGQRMLEALERANLFLVALDEERRWYRYHRLFADLLHVRLQERDRERVAELHGRAAAWCEEHGLVDDAVRHALAAGDAHRAAVTVERHVDQVLRRGEGATLRRWLATLPRETVRSRPGLCLMQAITAFNAGHHESVEALLEDAERALAATAGEAAPAADPESALAVIPASIASVRASLAFARGEPGRARRLARQALSLLSDPDRSAGLSVRWNLALADWMDGRTADAERAFADLAAQGRAAGLAHLALSAGAVQGMVQRVQGRLGAALDTYREGLDLGTAAGRPVVLTLGQAHIGVAEVLYERDQLDDALRHVGEGIELCRQLTSTQALATGLATLAWIRQAAGQPAAALEAMDEAYRVLPSRDAVSLSNPVPAERARLLLAQGEVLRAAGWVDERGLGERDEPTYAREREYLVLARLLLARGAHDDALALLGRLRSAAEAQGRTGSLIAIRALEALAADAAGDRPAALTSLAAALALGWPEGYVRVFADEGRPMAALLRGVLTAGRRRRRPAGDAVPTDYLGRLLRAVRQPQERTGPAPEKGNRERAPGLVEVLTDRELEILAMLASGRSNREIAEEFVVTLHTVKKHVTHILGKLGAANRTQAVAHARALGLI